MSHEHDPYCDCEQEVDGNKPSDLSELLCCPFCGGEITEHPTKRFREYYLVCWHESECYMCDSKSPFNFTLLPRNSVSQWNKRAT